MIRFLRDGLLFCGYDFFTIVIAARLTNVVRFMKAATVFTFVNTWCFQSIVRTSHATS